MSRESFSALVVSESSPGIFTRQITTRTIDQLPAGDVLVRVEYSSLNYKDALSASGNRGVTKRYPHTPGIDAAGTVHESTAPAFAPGDAVLVTGYDLGQNTDGGFAGYIRVPIGWVVKLPRGLSLSESMALGTAGLTAGIALQRMLNHGLQPGDGDVLVTGATGGVGSLAVALFAQAGFRVIASTGKASERQFLLDLGAAEVLSRDDVLDTTGKPLLGGRWAGAFDTVGGPTLDSIIRQIKPFGAVAACGNVTSGELHTSVYPFILRGVSLLGVNSAITPMPLRLEIWNKLAHDWKLSNLERIVTEVSLTDLNPYIDRILAGGVRGRVRVRVR